METIASATTRFLEDGRFLRNWSPKTVESYDRALKRFQRATTTTNVTELSKQDLNAFVLSMRQRGLTTGGCNINIRSVNSFLSWAHEQELTEPHLKMKVLPNPPRPVNTFSDVDIKRIVHFRPQDDVQRRAWTICVLLLDTGLRISEALTLQRQHVNLEDLNLRVLGKGSRERMVPISAEGRKHLHRWLSKADKHQLVFGNRRDQQVRYNNIYRDIRELCVAARIDNSTGKVHPHNFRHYFAVSYIRAGGDIYRLSRILGHSTISTTQIYLRSMGIEHLREGHSQFSPLSRA
jgi:site-specific recombinase XerD